MGDLGDLGGKILEWGYREEERAWRKEQQDWHRQTQLWRRRDMKWREEDRLWRRNDRRYRILENLRRKVDEWVELINDVSNICALVGGFAMAVLVEAPLDHFYLQCEHMHPSPLDANLEYECMAAQERGDMAPGSLLALFGVSSVSTVGAMLWCSVSCTRESIILLNNYLRPMSDARFTKFWAKFDRAWHRIMRMFHVGILSALVMVMCLVLAKFWPHRMAAWTSFTVACCFAVFILYTLQSRNQLTSVGPWRSLAEQPEDALKHHGHCEEQEDDLNDVSVSVNE